MSSFSDYQTEVYLGGLSGVTPELPFTADELAASAAEKFDPATYAYVAGGASAERTAQANIDAFGRYRIVPRVLRGTTGHAARDLSVDILGTTLSAPVLTAPIGVLELVHERGEIVVSSVTDELGLGTVLSSASSTTIEDVGAAVGGNWWFQLSWPADDELARSLVSRAAAANAKAIVVTVDAATLGWRTRDLALGHLPFLHGKGLANYLSDPVFRAKLEVAPEEGAAAMRTAILSWVGQSSNHTLAPADLGKLREWTNLPIVVKGVLHPDDARLVVDAGADGVVVSNHGGRQVDGAVAALDALPEVVAAVGDRTTVLFDSGVRTGSDLLIALALGAKAIFYGRPWVYGLGLTGRDGVRHVLRSLLADFDSAMGLSGCATVAEISHDLITREM